MDKGAELMNIHESAEDYLEAILVLRERLGLVRSIDVVHYLDYSKPSVSVAMKRLRENGYIEMDGEGYLTLLPPGEEIAQRIYTRHKLLTQFLIQLYRFTFLNHLHQIAGLRDNIIKAIP